MTTELALMLADEDYPGIVVGIVLGRLLILGIIIWGIVHLIRKRRSRRSSALHPPPQPYWDGAAWQYPQHVPGYSQQQYPPHQQQPYQHPHPEQPPHPGAPH